MTEMTKVNSSNIDCIGFDEDSSTLFVEFKTGGKYSYSGVSSTVFKEFMNAPSKGKFFHSSINKVYPFTKL